MRLPSNPIQSISLWFQKAKPVKTDDDFRVQLGVHFEEIAEMLDVLRGEDRLTQIMLSSAFGALHGLAVHLKNTPDARVGIIAGHSVEFIDSICDQIVTATGCGVLKGMNVTDALSEVDRSNWSKFVDDEPIFNDNGKIAKGPNYSKPELSYYT